MAWFFLEVVVMIIGVGAELQLLHLDDVLLAFGVVLLLFVLVLPLPIIHRFRYGRLRRGRDKIRSSPISCALRTAADVGMTSTLPSGKTARTSRARIASFTFSRIRGRRGWKFLGGSIYY